MNRNYKVKYMARVLTTAIICAIYFVVIIFVLHFLQPDYDPLSEPTSRYAVGQYGFLMTSAFLSMSLGSFTLVLGLSKTISQSAKSRIGLSLLVIWSVGLLIAMIFPIDPEGAPQTISGTVHRINGPFIFLSLTIGVILISRRFKQDEKFNPIYRFALILSLIMLAIFILTLLSIATESGLAGLCQRIYLTAFITWFLLITTRLHSIAVKAIPA